MKILIIQLRRIGDVIVTTPVIDVLRRQYPGAQIDFLVEDAPAPILQSYPGLNDVIIFDKKKYVSCVADIRRRGYDIVLDFMNNPRTAQITFMSGAAKRAGFRVPFWGFVYNVSIAHSPTPQYAVQGKFDLLRALGINAPRSVAPRLALTPQDLEAPKQFWRAQNLDTFDEVVGIVPTHRHAIRRWPADKFAALMDGLKKNIHRALVVFYGPGEQDYVKALPVADWDRIFLIPAGSLRQAAALLSFCDAVVTSDNGLMHLAVAVGTPTITIYGPTWPESWNPKTPPHRALQTQGLACVGCNKDVCPYQHECMEWMTSAAVLREVEDVLKKRAAPAVLGKK